MLVAKVEAGDLHSRSRANGEQGQNCFNQRFDGGRCIQR